MNEDLIGEIEEGIWERAETSQYYYLKLFSHSLPNIFFYPLLYTEAECLSYALIRYSKITHRRGIQPRQVYIN